MRRRKGWAISRLALAVVAAALVAGPTADTTGERFAGTPPGLRGEPASSPPPVASDERPRRTDARPEEDDSAPPPSPAPASSPDVTEVRYRVEVRTRDARTADFPRVVHDILTDPRGWRRAGFRFVADPGATYRIVIAEGDEVDRLCHPYDTAQAYSCQNGPVVALNADRWRSATPQWPGDLASYRAMLVNHEVGHLLHLHHPEPQCPAPGLPAPVMAQQSTTRHGCAAHSWPLQWEVDLAAERREPLAPSAHHDPADHRPAPPPTHS